MQATFHLKEKEMAKRRLEKRVCITDKEAEVEGGEINKKKAKGKPVYQQQFKLITS